MSIYQKLNNVMKKVAYVQKDSTVGTGFNSYKAVSHDAVTELVRPYFIDEGIIIAPYQAEKGISIDGKTSKGNDKIRFEAIYDIAFIDCEDSGSKVIVRVEAHAEDSGDKATGKALSYATKYAILKVLMLETGEDDEAGMKNTIDAKQTSIIAQLITDTDTDIEKFCGAYKIQKLGDLPSGQFQSALNQLQTKLKNAQAKK